jgi:hypothetical protein
MWVRCVISLFALVGSAFAIDNDLEAANILSSRQLRWQGNTIKVSVSSSLFNSVGIKSQSDVRGALVRALERWEEAGNVVFELSTTDNTSINSPGAAGDGVSLITIGTDGENLLAFGKMNSTASAITRVYHDGNAITESDIALNPSQLFSSDATPGTFDLESVFTHEIGHLLGLNHSLDPSAIMFDGVRRNGSVGSPGMHSSLSSDDRSKIRSLYRPSDGDGNCCLAISGQIGKLLETIPRSLVWLQSAKDGSVVQLVDAGRSGAFEFQGIARGNYQLLVQSFGEDVRYFSSSWSSIEIGAIPVKTTIPFGRKRLPFDLRRAGVNGQLSKRAVHVFAGNSYRLTIEGIGLRENVLKFGATNDGIVLDPLTAENPDFDKNLSILVFEVSISSRVRPGTYSIYAEDRSGARRYLAGAISVDGF